MNITGHTPNNGAILTNDGKEYQKPSKGRTIAAIAAGQTAAGAVQLAMSVPVLPATGKMSRLAQSADVVEIQKGLKKALKISGLEKKGVKIHDYAAKSPVAEVVNNATAQNDTIKELVKNAKTKKVKVKDVKIFDTPEKTNPAGISKFTNTLKKKFQDLIKMNSVSGIREGKNAAFIPGFNEVLINTEKLGTAGFHEIGHAINYNQSKFWKAMQGIRKPAMTIPAILTMIALCKRKKADGEQPTGFLDKTTTFIKNNVGKLSTISMLPIVAEELKATANGNKLAKQILSPENYKKVVQTNRFGAASYILAAVGMGVAAWTANKVRDKIASPKEIQQPQPESQPTPKETIED